jgi:hypothetical protein
MGDKNQPIEGEPLPPASIAKEIVEATNSKPESDSPASKIRAAHLRRLEAQASWERDEGNGEK